MRSAFLQAALGALAFPTALVLAQQGNANRLQIDRSRLVPAKSEIIAAWQKRQGAINTFRFTWTEEQTHPWIPTGWRVTEMLSDGSKRLVATARVMSYSINDPISTEEFR